MTFNEAFTLASSGNKYILCPVGGEYTIDEMEAFEFTMNDVLSDRWDVADIPQVTKTVTKESLALAWDLARVEFRTVKSSSDSALFKSLVDKLFEQYEGE